MRPRLQQGRPVIGIDGVTDMDAARELAGLEFRVPVETLAELPEGTYYHHQLVGCEVRTGRRHERRRSLR
ncbi:MAG: hypothetical protein QM736_10095 [Vicinamibacterales bacterium]